MESSNQNDIQISQSTEEIKQQSENHIPKIRKSQNTIDLGVPYIESNNIIKHNGSIFKSNCNTYRVTILNTNGKLDKTYRATFKTYDEAFQHLKDKNKEFGIQSNNRIYEFEDHYKIELNQNQFMMIDKEDLFLAETYSICCDYQNENRKYCQYYNRFNKKKAIFHHLIIMFDPILHKDLVVDHIQNGHLDNRKQNLRIITQSQNVRNSINYKTTSNFIGVNRPKKGKSWIASFQYKGQQYRKTGFETEDLAAIWLQQKTEEIIPENERYNPNKVIMKK